MGLPRDPDSPRGAWDNVADRRFVAAAIGLSAAAVIAPLAAMLTVAIDASRWSALPTSGLIAALIVAPACVGLAMALIGPGRVAMLTRQAGNEAEHAVFRVFAANLLLGYALVLVATTPPDDTTRCLAVAALSVVVAWALLPGVVLWSTAPPWRCHLATIIDTLLISALLHFGGSKAAGWYPLYIVSIVYTGLRFGRGLMLPAAAAGILGFAGVVLATPNWRQQPALSAGLLVALLVLPALLAALIRKTASPGNAATQSSDARDFAALETGIFAAANESFDLRVLIRHSMAPFLAKAAATGVSLRWRVDPHLPYRLQGPASALARIIDGLADAAIRSATTGASRLVFGGVAKSGRLRLDLSVHGLGDWSDGLPPSMQLVQRFVAMANGAIAIERSTGPRSRLTISLPLAIDRGAPAPTLDCGRCPVLIVTEDDELARDLAEPLAIWNAQPHWPADADAALADLTAIDAATRAVVIIDGRAGMLAALGLAHQAATLGTDAPFVLLIAEEAYIDGLTALDEGLLDGLLPAPVTEALLAKALYALPLKPDPANPPEVDPASPVSALQNRVDESTDARVTPIAAHLKFSHDAAATAALNPRAVEALRSMGSSGFLGEVIDSFRNDAARIMQRLDDAVRGDDLARFVQGVMALRRAAGYLGGTQLSDLAASLQRLSAGELRQDGAHHIQRLDSEITRLAEALTSVSALPTNAGDRSAASQRVAERSP